MSQSATKQKASKDNSHRPVHVVRFGALKAAIWENETSAGKMFNVTVSRSYKDGDDWKESSSFGLDDLLPLAKAIDQAHTWICEERQRRKSEQG